MQLKLGEVFRLARSVWPMTLISIAFFAVVVGGAFASFTFHISWFSCTHTHTHTATVLNILEHLNRRHRHHRQFILLLEKEIILRAHSSLISSIRLFA